MSITCILIDDEARSREALSGKLKSVAPQLDIVAQCASAKEGLAAIEEFHPDLVFLDVEMPVMSGFAMLESLEKIDFDVVFVTAYDQYALRAFRFSALDYLLKPVDPGELKKCVLNFETKFAARKQHHLGSQLNELLANFRSAGNNKIALPTSEGYQFVFPDDIVRIQSDSNYCEFYFKNGKKLVVSRTLKEYETLLEDSNFCRVHNSHLVNLRFVSKYLKGEGGYLVLEDGTSIEVSTRKKPVVMQRLAGK
jgi:two-component system LytT family response regulator